MMRAHTNNIGFLRLVFAMLVIVGHAPQMIEGVGSRSEILHAIFGTTTTTLGMQSVMAFFLLSGYLITSSMLSQKSVGSFIWRRCLRIIPAFYVAYLLTVFIMGPLVDAHPWPAWKGTFERMLLLKQPLNYPGQLPGLSDKYPLLNGSMWTIQHEFQCYMLIAFLWSRSLLEKRGFVLALCVIFTFLRIIFDYGYLTSALIIADKFPLWGLLIEDPADFKRSLFVDFVAVFLVGTCFRLYRDEIYRFLTASISVFFFALYIVGIIANTPLTNAFLPVFAALPLFWLALKAEFGRLQQINDRWDISYGTYLYGWPIATYLRWIEPQMGIMTLIGLTLPLALVAGAVSWWGLERWFRPKQQFSSNTRLAPSSV